MMTAHIAAKTRAMQIAKQRVIERIKAQGYKPSSLSCAQMKEWAQLYLEDNPTVYLQALIEVDHWIKAGHFGKRAQKAALGLAA